LNETLAGLEGLAGRLAELGPEGERLGQALRTWLAPGARMSFEEALGLAPGARAAWWRRRRTRAYLELAVELAGGLPVLRQAIIVRRALLRYSASRWRVIDQLRTAPPERNALLFQARYAGGGVPSEGSLRRMFGAMSNPDGYLDPERIADGTPTENSGERGRTDRRDAVGARSAGAAPRSRCNAPCRSRNWPDSSAKR
jgi:hypothetical protein